MKEDGKNKFYEQESTLSLQPLRDSCTHQINTRAQHHVSDKNHLIREEREKQLNKILRFFQIEAYKKYDGVKIRHSIDQFIDQAKAINKKISRKYQEDSQYKEHLESALYASAIQCFPHRHFAIRLVLDLVLWPLCFIKKALTGSWFFTTADTNRVRLFKAELIDAKRAATDKNWPRLVQLCNRGETIPNWVRESAVDNIIEDGAWEAGFKLEKAFKKEDYSLTQGPLQKSVYTEQLEELTHKLLLCKNYEVIRSDFSNLIKFDKGEVFNATTLFKYANLNHLQLNGSDYQLYRKQFVATPSTYKHLLSKFPGLTIAELSAIRRYSSIGFIKMNALLRGNYDYKRSKSIRADILATVMCASGLAKTPDRKINVCYRNEDIYDKSEHYKRIKAAATQGVVQLSGFVSTTTTEKHSSFKHQVQFAIKNLTGKYIGELSLYPAEQEFLILPTQIQVDNYKYQSGRHFFSGSMVSDLASVVQPEETSKRIMASTCEPTI